MTTTQTLRPLGISQVFAEIFGLCVDCAPAWIEWNQREGTRRAYRMAALIAQHCRKHHRHHARYIS